MNGIAVLLVGGKKESGKSTVAKMCEEKFGAVTVSFSAPMKRFAAALGMPIDNLWGSTAKRDEVIPTPAIFKELPPEPGSTTLGWPLAALFAEAVERHLQPVFGLDTIAHLIIRKWLRSEYLWLNGGYHGEGPKHPFTCRHALQTLGTECGRSINPDCWVNYGLEVALQLLSGEYDYRQLDGLLSRRGEMPAVKQPPRMVVIDDCRFPNELVIGKVKGAKGMLVERPSTDHRAGGHASERSLDFIPLNWWDTSVRNDSTLIDLQSAVFHKLNALGFTAGLQNSI